MQVKNITCDNSILYLIYTNQFKFTISIVFSAELFSYRAVATTPFPFVWGEFYSAFAVGFFLLRVALH